MDNVTSSKKYFSVKNYKYGRHIVLCILFFFYNYTFSMVNSSFDYLINYFYDEKGSILHIRLILLSFAAALVIFGILFSVVKIKPVHLSRFVGIITLCTTLMMLLLFKSNNKHAFLLSMYLMMFLIGIECVYYYMLMYRAFSNMSHTGIIFIISMSSSIILQYFMQVYKNENLMLYSLIIITFISAFMNLSGASEGITDINGEDKIDSDLNKKDNFLFVYITMIVSIILFECIGNFLSYPLLSLIYSGNALVFDTPRLFIIFSYIIMGIFADIKNMRYIPIITLAGVLIGILNPVLIHADHHLYINTCIYYIVAGIINSFFMLIMFKLAEGHRFAPLIAVSGRVVDSIFSCVFTSTIMINFPLYYIIGIELAAIIIIMLLFTFTGQFSFEQDRYNAVIHISPMDFATRFGLSEKETDVFLTALSFDGNMSELAKTLYMSRSVLYRNLSNICDKTGCGSFQAVKALYYDLPAETPSMSDKTAEITTFDDKEYNDNVSDNKTDSDNSMSDKIDYFAHEYALSEKEVQTLTSFLENPDKTQKELADMQGITLRTIQRHLANIKTKTGTKSLAELSKLFYSDQSTP